MCFVFIWEQTATCATYIINWLVFITEMKSVYCVVRTGSLNKAVCASYLKGKSLKIKEKVSYEKSGSYCSSICPSANALLSWRTKLAYPVSAAGNSLPFRLLLKYRHAYLCVTGTVQSIYCLLWGLEHLAVTFGYHGRCKKIVFSADWPDRLCGSCSCLFNG